jgi:hypothetical protein
MRARSHGTQTPYPRRYARPAVERERSPRRRAGSRWCPPGAADGAPFVSLHRAHLRRCRLPGAEDGEGRGRYRLLDPADRQAQRGPSLRCLAQAMDRRAHDRMDQPKPPSGARLRALRQNRRRLCPPRHDPYHAQTLDQIKPLPVNLNFLDRLLEVILVKRPAIMRRAGHQIVATNGLCKAHRLRFFAEPARRSRPPQHHVGKAANTGRRRGASVEDALGLDCSLSVQGPERRLLRDTNTSVLEDCVAKVES